VVVTDRFGLLWRPALAAGILENLDRIDLIEVIADGYFDAPKQEIEALRTMGANVPLVLHGVSMGLASAAPVEKKRIERMARLIDRVRPDHWSEHLAFVRGGGVEIGHLAAPPRTQATIEGTAENLARVARVTGMPLIENVATLIDPPASTCSEADWIRSIARETGAGLLLDLHNLYANAINFGSDPAELLGSLPLERVREVHLAGGRWLRGRLLDDHLHAVPDPVFDLLSLLGARAPNLDVIVERDDCLPPIEVLLAELDRARAALSSGRRAREAA
jgi:hypothetical protein